MVGQFSGSDEIVSLREAMDRLLAESFVGGPFRSFWSVTPGTGAARMPLPLDVFATADELVLIAAVPGLGPDDIEITVNQGTVLLSGKTPNVAASEAAKNATWYLHELPHGAFQRSVTLPTEIDATRADATFEHGILRLRLPKAEQSKPKQIKIRAGTSQAIDSGTAEPAS